MDKNIFAGLVKQQLNLNQPMAVSQPEELARHFLDDVAGGVTNDLGVGFINGYFSSFYQSQPGGGTSYDKILVPQAPDPVG
jgi:hypothetical protein